LAQLDLTCDYGDMRSPSIPDTWKTDYIIDGLWLPSPGGLGIWMGNNDGDFALFTPGTSKHMSLQHKFNGGPKCGHSAIVRSALYDEKNGCVISGGEDSSIHIWPIETADTSVTEDDWDVVMYPPSPPPSPTIRKRKNEETMSSNKKGRQGWE